MQNNSLYIDAIKSRVHTYQDYALITPPLLYSLLYLQAYVCSCKWIGPPTLAIGQFGDLSLSSQSH